MDSYITIDGWRSNIRFSSAHIIHEYEKCGRLHGHTYAIHAKISGDTDDKGIILDFSVLKDVLREIANYLDHKVLIPEKSSVAKIQKNKKDVKITALGKTFVFPFSDCVFLPISSTSAENIARYILDYVVKNLKLPLGVNCVEIGVDEGYGQGARISTKIK
jgi:6-pyruvoyltetrahydropterin/6-carboxytetrahydropterin synthase